MGPGYNLVYVPTKLRKPFHEMSKKEAKDFFEWFTNIKEERLKNLCDFIKRNVDITFKCDFTKESLIPLLKSFYKVVAFRPMTETEMQECKDKYFLKFKGDIEIPTKKLDDASVSFCFDAGIYYGETLIRLIDGLHWGYNYTAKKFVDYAQPI